MYYKHSGRFTLGGAIVGLVSGLGGGFVLAYAYGVGLVYVPEVHLAAFATIFFGILVGLGAGMGLVWGKVRNRDVAIFVSAVTSLMALYVSWAFWIPAVFVRGGGKHLDWFKLAQRPDAIWRLMKWINQYGTWTIDKGNPTVGWALWVVWFLEAAIVVGFAIVIALTVQRAHPFCETCGLWCKRAARFFLTPVADVNQLRLCLEAKNLQSLDSLGPGSKVGDHLAVELHSCSSCGQFHTLSVVQIVRQKKKFGQPTIHSHTIVRQLIVGPSEAQAIHQLSARLAQAPKLVPEGARAATAGKS